MPTKTYPKTTQARWSTVDEQKSQVNGNFVTYNGGSFNLDISDSFTGYDNPGWRLSVAAGGNATTGASGRRQFLQGGDYGFMIVDFTKASPLYQLRKTTLTGNRSGTIQIHNGTSVSSSASMDMAKRIFVSRAKDLLTPAQGGVILGELTKTLHTIRNPMLAIREQIRAYFGKLKKVSPKYSSAQRARALSDSYLELTYAWTPLFYDVQGGLTVLRKHAYRSIAGVERVSAKGHYEESGPPSLGTFSPVGGALRTKYVDTTIRERTTWLKGGVRVQSYGLPDSSILNEAGISLPNFLPTAWELLPYSFLIDYFANIGTIIDAFSLVNGSISWNCYTERTTTKTTRNIEPDMAYIRSFSGSALFSPFRPSVLKRIDFVRGTLSSLVPSLVFRLPGLETKQSLNIAALLFSNGVKRPFY